MQRRVEGVVLLKRVWQRGERPVPKVYHTGRGRYKRETPFYSPD